MRPAFFATLLLLLSGPGRLAAQSVASPWAGIGIEANAGIGKVLKHTAKFKAPIPDRSTAFELNLVQQTDGRRAWQQRRRYPVVGLGLMYTRYGIDSIYGSCIALYPNVQIPLVRGRRLEWTLRAGFGLGYATKHFERTPVWDTLNNAIGSHINNFSIFRTDLRFHLSEQLDIQAGMSFTHMSNAAFRQPNLGVNMFAGSIGLRYFPVTSRPDRNYAPAAPLPNRWIGGLRLGLSMNEVGAGDGPIYPVYLVTAYAGRRWHSHNRAFLGLDYSYHSRIEAFQRNNEINPGRERAHSWKSAVIVGNEFVYGRFGILLQVGVYLRQAALPTDGYYQKLGGIFYLIQDAKGPLKDLTVHGLLKTHKSIAELGELGIGIGF